MELRKEDEARVANLRKGQTGGSAAIYPEDRAERKKFIQEWNQKVADYQAELKRVHKEEKAKEKAKEDRRPEVDRILKESGGWKQLYSDRKTVALPPDIPNAPPAERLEWR